MDLVTCNLTGPEGVATDMSILNQELWDTGTMSTSSMRMLRRFMAKLLAGQPVTVGEVCSDWDSGVVGIRGGQRHMCPSHAAVS